MVPRRALSKIWRMQPLTDGAEHLRVLIANERKDQLALVAPVVASLGHEVIAREISVEDVGATSLSLGLERAPSMRWI